MIKKFLGAAAVVASLFAGAASAAPVVLHNWKFDGDGAGGAAAVNVTNYLDFNGNAFIQNTFVQNSTAFSFNEAGTFVVALADSTKLLPPGVSASFVGTGTGNTATGVLNFDTTGILRIFNTSSALIGTFQVASGSAVLAANSTIPQGTVSIIFQALTLASGYFFDSANVDLSTKADVTLGFATTNALRLENETASTDIQTLYTSRFGADATGYTDNGFDKLVISNNGQFQLANQVPEPGSMALIGLGLVGVVALRRRKAATPTIAA